MYRLLYFKEMVWLTIPKCLVNRGEPASCLHMQYN